MTSLEHVSVKHALDRLPSWTGSVHVGVGVDGNEVRAGDKARSEGEGDGEEVGVGVAVTTPDHEEDAPVGITVEPGIPRADNEDGNGNGEEEEDEENARGGVGTAAGASHRGVSSLDSVSRSWSPSDWNSRSRSSVRGPLEAGESSVATSWTQADAEGVVGRPSGDGGSEQRACGEVRCHPSVDGLELEGEAVDVGAGEKVPRGGTEVTSQPHSRTSTDRNGGTGCRDVSRKEEVLVMQEEDIGEVWHPLQYSGKARSQDDVGGEGEKREVEEDVGSARVLESEHGDQSVETNEKERWRTFGSSGSSGSVSGRNARHLRLEFKASTPQPWDEIDPPLDNNETYASDYYSTLNSKKFGTLQKSRRRPLIPHSTYYFGPPPPDSAYGTPPVGQIGVHHPREIIRIERDYAGGELTQFSPVFPLELEGRITPTQFHQTINDINEILISAHSIRHAFLDNFLAVVTLQLSTLIKKSHYIKEMRRLKRKIEELNTQLYNPVGLSILWPQKVAFLFLEIEYY